MPVATTKIPLNDSTFKTQARAMDIRELSKEELESLKENDPFMYYSIPGIRMATIFGKDINASDKGALCLHVSDGQQEPAFKKAKTASRKSTTMVPRQTRISFEAPMNLGCLFVDNEVDEEDDEFDVLDALIMHLHKWWVALIRENELMTL